MEPCFRMAFQCVLKVTWPDLALEPCFCNGFHLYVASDGRNVWLLGHTFQNETGETNRVRFNMFFHCVLKVAWPDEPLAQFRRAC